MSIKLKSLIPEHAVKFEPKKGERHMGYDFNRAYELIIKNCHVALKKINEDIRIYRGEKNINDKVYIIHPDTTPRSSKDTSNSYNLYMTESPAWEEYPLRTHSVIFGNWNVASSYAGNNYPHLILPMGNPTVAVSPTRDFWNAKVKLDYQSTTTGEKYSMTLDAERFGHNLDSLFKGIGIANTRNEKDPKKFDDNVNKLIAHVEKDVANHDKSLNHNLWLGAETMYDILYSVIEDGKFDPKITFYNFFTPEGSLTTLTKLSELKSLSTEAWTNGGCIAINSMWLPEIFKDKFEGSVQNDDFRINI